MVIKRIGIGSAAKMYGALCFVIGFLLGCIFALAALAGAGLMSSQSDSPAWMGPLFGVGAIIFLPIVYGVFGFIVGAIMAAVFNLTARIAGGLEIDVQQ